MSLDGVSYTKSFDRIYVEREAAGYPLAVKILDRLDGSAVTYIDHYKDVFNRPRQSYNAQRHSRKLILAVNRGKLIHEGAPVCQDYDESRFYYTSNILGCPFDCEYCFLKGRYGTANIVIFVNTDDYLKEADRLGSSYLCVSFDTDLPAMESIASCCSLWADFARSHPDTNVEIRTKAVVNEFISLPNLIYAFTLSPEDIIKRYEHGTAGLGSRIDNIRRATDAGCRVRICIDPVIYCEGWESKYEGLIAALSENIDFDLIGDFGIGSFRISAEYIKAMRRCEPCSPVVQFSFETRDGYCVYPDGLPEKMVNYVRDKICEVNRNARIFCQY